MHTTQTQQMELKVFVEFLPTFAWACEDVYTNVNGLVLLCNAISRASLTINQLSCCNVGIF